MNESADRPSPHSALEGYRAAITMVSYEGQLIWRVFACLLASNAFVVALVSAYLELHPENTWLPRLLPFLGIFICLVWILITMRQFDYYKYWFAWARQLEKTGLASELGMVAAGKRFSDGETVTVDGKEYRMGWGSRLFRIQWLVYTVILLFIIVYIFLLVDAF
jgi:hypothetical protein